MTEWTTGYYPRFIRGLYLRQGLGLVLERQVEFVGLREGGDGNGAWMHTLDRHTCELPFALGLELR